MGKNVVSGFGLVLVFGRGGSTKIYTHKGLWLTTLIDRRDTTMIKERLIQLSIRSETCQEAFLGGQTLKGYAKF